MKTLDLTFHRDLLIAAALSLIRHKLKSVVSVRLPMGFGCFTNWSLFWISGFVFRIWNSSCQSCYPVREIILSIPSSPCESGQSMDPPEKAKPILTSR